MMNSLTSKLRAFATDESGQDLVEYALIAALVGLGVIASLKSVTTNVGTVFTTIGTTLSSAV
jgi:pilus assembly protein Flp/PilA